MQTIIKVFAAALIIVAVTEIAKRIPRVGGLILSLPLTSVIALVWLYVATRNAENVAALSISTFWFVIPSLLLFVLLTEFLRRGLPFLAAMAIACGVTAGLYALWPTILGRFGIKF